MARKIVVDPAKLETAAGKMTRQKEDYVRLYNQLFTEVNGMKAAWDGKDNDEFTKQIAEFKPYLDDAAKVLEQYAEFLTISAGNYKNTQEELTNSAKRLSN